MAGSGAMFLFPSCGKAHLMFRAKDHLEVLDPEQEDHEESTEQPAEEEPLTAPEPDTLPPDPDITAPEE